MKGWLTQLALSLLIAALVTSTARAETVLVFAAASLAESMTEIADRFAQDTGDEVVVSLGSSSTLARQVEARAPANIFISANQEWLDYLVDRQAVLSETQIPIAQNTLVLVASPDAIINEDDRDLTDITRLLGIGRLAIGDPAHVPAGIYAKEALETLGVWDNVSDRLAPASNVRAALRFVEQSAVRLGVVYRTDAMASKSAQEVAPFPADSHPRIVYPAVITAEGDSKATRAFMKFLSGDDAIEILTSHGFVAPVEADP
ncbi:MAG: molybdate ABC transporter substrate-binding protein [Pseudomonadota bacterium]